MHAVPPAVPHRFAGFSRESLELLRQLEANNDVAWFEARRQLFKDLLVEPAIDLVIEIGPLLRQQVGHGLRAEPRVGGSILRMRHDARFMRDRPFRTHLELWFWEGRGPSHQHPGFFIRLGADELVLGAGLTLFPPHVLLRYRDQVDQPRPGRELVALLRGLEAAGSRVEGPRLRRVPPPFPADHERAELLRQLGLRVERTESLPEAVPEAILGPLLPELLVNAFGRHEPLRRWLLRLE
ncbi:MAG: DUF2461 family protein [Chloroflexi bacterium]|nr:MAG: DUF2461 family protein [Chloroflexota bacterium]